MIIKSSSLLYLFDFDGTLAGTDLWKGYYSNAKAAFQQLHFNPNQLDIRWCILTSRPEIDRPLIKLLCRYHNLNPQQIIMGPTFTWKFKHTDEIAKYKSNVIKSILTDNYDIGYTYHKIEKVIYIDNDSEITIPMNSYRDGYQYIAINVPDLLLGNMQEVIL